MKKVLLSLLAVCLVPTIGSAVECANCTMGIYDTTAMTANYGIFDGASKELHLGVIFDAAVAEGLSGVEFSVQGLSPFFVNFEPSAGAAIDLGSIQAPADPSGSGGKNIGWSSCQDAVNGQFVFGKLTLIALGGPGSVGDDIVLSIDRRYPPTNPNDVYPLFNQCNAPQYTATGVQAGCYVINPTVGPGGTVGGCTLTGTAVENTDWSTIKSLYQ